MANRALLAVLASGLVLAAGTGIQASPLTDSLFDVEDVISITGSPLADGGGPSVLSTSTDVWLDYTDFTTRLGELASSAGVTAFSGAEETTIKSNILSKLTTIYSAYPVTFSETTPAAPYETINFGLTASPGSLGLADQIDYRNLTKTDTARVFTANFDFILDEFSGSTSRPTQIDQLSAALAGTAGHELGHNLGLRHHDAYGFTTMSYDGSAGVATGGLQNDHIMATGSTGLGETGRETDRTFSQLAAAKLDYGDGLSASPPSSTAEQVPAHGSSATAQALSLVSLPSSGLLGQNVIGSISASGEFDYYSFSALAGDKVTLDINSEQYGSPVDTILALYDTDGTSVLGSNDDTLYSTTALGSGTTRTFDSILVNVPLASTGTYFFSVRGFGSDTGPYEALLLKTGPSIAFVPEPASLGLWLLLGFGFVGLRRRRRRNRGT